MTTTSASRLRLRLKIRAMATEAAQANKKRQQFTKQMREMLIRDRLAAGGLSEKQIDRIATRAIRRHLFVKPVLQIVRGRQLSENTLKEGLKELFAKNKGVAPEWLSQKITDLNYLRATKLFMRPQIRHALLALTFLRGRPYSHAENFAFMNEPGRVRPNEPVRGRYLPPSWVNVRGWASLVDSKKVEATFDLWMNEAKKFRADSGIDDGSKKRDNPPEVQIAKESA